MKSIYCIFLIGFFSLVACQSDDFEIELDDEQTRSSSDEITNLLSRAAQNPTAFDNFIDGSSTTSIAFPFMVEINNQNIVELTTENDYQNLIDEMNSYPTKPHLELKFPVEVSLVNYETRSIQNEAEFRALITEAKESTEINCIDFSFPLRLNFFNSTNEINESVVLQNKAQFFNFIENFKADNAFYEFDFPLEMKFESLNLSLNSFAELESAFANLDFACYEPLLYEFEPEQPDLITFLTEGEFVIVNFVNDGDIDTEDFNDFIFTYNSDNSVSVVNTATQAEFIGNWEVEFDDGIQKLDLVFNDDELDELDEDWDITDFGNSDQLVLLDEPNSDLVFEKL